MLTPLSEFQQENKLDESKGTGHVRGGKKNFKMSDKSQVAGWLFLNCFGGWRQISLVRNDCCTGSAGGLLARYDLSATLPTGHKYDYTQELIIRKMIKAVINPLLNYFKMWLEMRQLWVHSFNWHLKSQRVNWWAAAAVTFCLVMSY